MYYFERLCLLFDFVQVSDGDVSDVFYVNATTKVMRDFRLKIRNMTTN